MTNLIYSNKAILLEGKISGILSRVQADQEKFSLPVPILIYLETDFV